MVKLILHRHPGLPKAAASREHVYLHLQIPWYWWPYAMFHELGHVFFALFGKRVLWASIWGWERLTFTKYLCHVADTEPDQRVDIDHFVV